MSLKKIYHIADVHIRNVKRHKEYRQVFEKMFDEILEIKFPENGYSLDVKTNSNGNYVVEVNEKYRKTIRKDMMNGYDRNNNLYKAGFAAGPCLVKDTMQLSSLFNKRFFNS